MKNEATLRVVWGNDSSKRYVPQAFESGKSGWGVFDQRESKFVPDEKIKSINPSEPLNLN